MFDEKEKVLIVSDRDYFYSLFKFKNSNPTLNLKIIDKEELIDKLSFTLKKDPLPKLLKLGKEYSKAKKYLSLLRVSNYRNNEELVHLFAALKDEYFEFDEYGLIELQSYNIFLFEMEEDVEIHGLLKRNNLKEKELTFDDLNIKTSDIKPQKITYFKDKYYQYSYIYSDIRSKIIREPILKDKIKILVSDESDIFFVNLMSVIFKIDSITKINKSFIEYEDVKSKIESIYHSHSFDFTDEEKKNERLLKLDEVINHYDLTSLDFTFAYANLLEIVSSLKEQSYLNDRGIRVDDKFKIDDSLVYVTNFVQGSFYRIYDDKNVLSDSELKIIDANPSYVSTNLDRRKKINYLKYSNLALVSRVKKHLKDNIYDSQFIDELSDILKTKNKEDTISNYIENKDFNENGLYTDEASKLFTSTKLDEHFFYGKIEEFNSYDHEYKEIKGKKLFEPKHYSITNLESYMSCPFKFILSKKIPLKEQDLLYADIGTFIHSFLEDINHPDFDFDKSFNRAFENYRANLTKQKKELTPKDEVEVEILKNSLKLISPSIREMYKDVDCVEPTKGSEQKIEFSLDDVVAGQKVSYPFSGRIDKIVVTRNANNEKFFTVIDYKTGNRVFDSKVLFLGKELQLPIYTYALLNTSEGKKLVDEAKFGAFGYQRVLYKTPKELFSLKNKKPKYSIQKLEENVSVQGFDCKESEFYSSLKIGEEEHVNLYKKPEKKANSFVPLFNNIIEDALKGTKSVIRKIVRNEFPIAPTSSDLKGNESFLECKNCGYRDICYRTKKDFKSYKKEIDEHKSSLKEER